MYIENLLFNLINRPKTYIGEAPMEVADCQWIRTSSGRSQVYFNKTNIDTPTYSIYTRGVSNEETLKRSQEIFKQIRNWTDSQSALIATRTPHFVGRDEKNRSVWMFHIEFLTGGY